MRIKNIKKIQDLDLDQNLKIKKIKKKTIKKRKNHKMIKKNINFLMMSNCRKLIIKNLYKSMKFK